MKEMLDLNFQRNKNYHVSDIVFNYCSRMFSGIGVRLRSSRRGKM